MLSTPCLVLNLAHLKRNVAAVQKLASAHGKQLRPHAKTHKSATIAKLQVDAGAFGICVAKLSEAEALYAAGFNGSILVTSPIVAAHRLQAFAALHATHADLSVVLQDEEGARALADAVSANNVPVDVLIEVECGQQRTGCAAARVPALARLIRSSLASALRLRGIQCYAGHLQHVASYAEREQLYRAAMAIGAGVVAALKADGFDVDVFSGGGTGSLPIDVTLPFITELQCGSYCLMDAEYAAIEWSATAQQLALTSPQPPLCMRTTVLNASFDSHLVVDAGEKAMPTSGGTAHVVGDVAAHYTHLGDEHGKIAPRPKAAFKQGDQLDLVVAHVDPTVNQFDAFYTTDNEKILIDARGCYT